MENKRLFEFISSILAILVFVFVLLYFSKPKEDHNVTLKRYCITQKNKVFNGVVIRSYYSKRLIFVLQDSNIYAPQCLRITREIEIGDSIYKPSGTFSCNIYKKANPDSVVFVECEFDCNVYDQKIERR